MKHIFYFLLATLTLAGCMNSAENKNEDNEGASGKRNVSTRDRSITKANSYSGLFLDSASLGDFIAGNHVADSTANRMISFYTPRNYQYAWFTGDGFTEEAQSFWNLFDHYLTYSGDTSLANKPLEKQMNRL